MRDLIDRAQRGDHDAFDELAARVGPDLYRLAMAVIGPDGAADATQDALLRAWRELPTLRDRDAFPAWTRRILVNRCRDMVRARRGVRLLSLDVAPAIAGGGPVDVDHAPGVDRSTDLRSAVARLNVDQRAVVALHYQLDLSIRDVARTLAVPDGTVKSRLSAALVALRRSLEDPADA
jgi:RNA polymerase sigma-70 factor (ECF subfamily)